MPGPTVAIVPARGGSKSVPGKNIKPLGGKPLIAWSIEVASAVPQVDRVIVSTDDDDIADVATAFGAEVYRRPAELATDTALVLDAVRHLLSTLRGEGFAPRVGLLLEPTCPFRSVEDVTRCLDLLEDDTVDSVATFVAARLNPARAWRVEGQRPVPFIEGLDPWQPRQRLPSAYQLSGGVYAFRADRLTAESPSILFGNAAAVVVSPERSVDIDDALDFMLAEAVLARRASVTHSRAGETSIDQPTANDLTDVDIRELT
ncbi:MAG TPA: acylneuraminate cytidylyltransferase family protein [Rhodothermales bacterium]